MNTPIDPVPDNPLEQQIADAVADFLDLQTREEAVDVEAFCRRHEALTPWLREELQATLQIAEMLRLPAVPEPRAVAERELPETLSNLKILGEIGSGGMGRVLLAMDERLGRKVAIKTLRPRYLENDLLRARFMQEARAMARLSHPHIIRIYNLGRSEEIPHFVMEYVEGRPLTEAARAMTLRQKAELMNKVVRAVDFLHQHRLIHRDLKPGNILVGPDLEPVLLDFGLALQVDAEGRRLTLDGEVAGTPDYLSPEQTRGERALDMRTDIFSLGAILYELLTGVAPFRADSFTEQMRMIREADPALPRRINPALPGALQNICLKALEKRPAERYGSAREMAEDLDRFLAGEAVLAAPLSYSRLMSGKIEQHLRELEGWRQDKILSEDEFDSFQRLYDRLVEREDAWLLEARRLSLSQVTLYLGAWVLVVAAALVALFRYPGVAGTRAVLMAAGGMLPTLLLGVRCWRQGLLRIGIAFLIAFCLLLPVTLLVMMTEWSLFSALTQNREELEFFWKISWAKHATNAQMWWALALSLPAYVGLRRFTRASVFSLVFAAMAAMLCLVTLLRMGMLDWLTEDPGRVFLNLLPFAGLFFLAGFLIERANCPDDSRYVYPIAVLFTLASLSGVAAFHEPYAKRLSELLPRTRGQLEYLFILNAAIYLALQSLCERFGTAQMRWVARWFRFVIPGHVMVSLLLLGIGASDLWTGGNPAYRGEARFFEILLPLVACLFVFGSIPKQMKNFLATGLIFLAIGIVRLQRDLFSGRAAWPLSLLTIGLLLMIVAANFTPIKLWLARRFFFPGKN